MKPRHYWNIAAKIGREVFEGRAVSNVDEQAGPAYFEGLAPSRWLFWKRLKLVFKEISTMRGTIAVDFGCGFGLAIPQLREQFALTLGVDLVPELSKQFIHRWDETVGTHGHQVTIVKDLNEAGLAPGSVDLILALDVLEHFESPTDILSQFHTLLSPSGVLVVSGPTENLLYRLGRKVVGFSGDYHHQDVYQVIDAMSRFFEVTVTHSFPFPIPLFLICSATKKLQVALK